MHGEATNSKVAQCLSPVQQKTYKLYNVVCQNQKIIIVLHQITHLLQGLGILVVEPVRTKQCHQPALTAGNHHTVIQSRLDSTHHEAMHPQVLQQAPEEMVLDLVMRWFNIHKAEVERLVGMHVLVNAILKGERMGMEPRPGRYSV